MTITSTPQAPIFKAAQAPQNTPPAENTPPSAPPNDAPPPQDQWEKPEKDDASMTWKAIRAIPSAVAGAVICGVGAGAASLVDVPRVGLNAAHALWNTPKIGTNLKVMTGALLPFGAAASMILSPIAGALYGLCTGFVNGAERGVLAAADMAAHDVGRYHKEAVGSAIKWLKEEQTSNLPEGQEPYDISLKGAAKGLAGAAVGGTMTGVAATALAAGYAIPGAIRLEAELWKSDIPFPFKVVGTPIVPVAVGLGAALAPAAGALFGIGMGAKDSYTDGIGKAVSNQGDAIKEANKFLFKAVFE